MKVGQYPSIYELNEEINNKSFIKMLGDSMLDIIKMHVHYIVLILV